MLQPEVLTLRMFCNIETGDADLVKTFYGHVKFENVEISWFNHLEFRQMKNENIGVIRQIFYRFQLLTCENEKKKS